MPRRHFQHQKIGLLGGPQHRPGQAEFVVERPGRCHHLTQGAQDRRDEILGRRLARRSGDSDDAQPAVGQVGGHHGGESGQCAQHGGAGTVAVVLEHSGLGIGCHRRWDHDGRYADRSGRQHGDRAGGHGGGGEVMAVGIGSGQRQEQPAGDDGPRIELDRPGHQRRRRLGRVDIGQPAADDVGDLGHGQSDHRARSSSARASSSRSSKGRVVPPAV